MKRKDVYEKITEGPHKGSYRIFYDRKNRWGPIVNYEQVDEWYSRYMNSGMEYDDFVHYMEWDYIE